MKNYYILSNGRVRRESNSLVLERADGNKAQIPVEDVDCLYLYGEVDVNTKLLTFLSSRRLPLHVFNYYGFYSGSYYPREYLHSGHLLVRQVAHYTDAEKRLALARELVRASAHSILRNIAYYENRQGDEGEPAGDVAPQPEGAAFAPSDAATEQAVDSALAFADSSPYDPSSDPPTGEETADMFRTGIAFGPEGHPLAALKSAIITLSGAVDFIADVNQLRGVEGKIRTLYYAAWEHILAEGWVFDRRTRRPPENEINALISFGNSMLYTNCLSEIYRTQLTPTISYLHEPGARRFSLALDLSEIFKPLIVDRAIFRLINKGQIKAEHFDRSLGGCYLTEPGKRLFLGALDERLASTIRHRRLNRHVSYRHLIRLECYKLIRSLTDLEPYRAFRAWW